MPAGEGNRREPAFPPHSPRARTPRARADVAPALGPGFHQRPRHLGRITAGELRWSVRTTTRHDPHGANSPGLSQRAPRSCSHQRPRVKKFQATRPPPPPAIRTPSHADARDHPVPRALRRARRCSSWARASDNNSLLQLLPRRSPGSPAWADEPATEPAAARGPRCNKFVRAGAPTPAPPATPQRGRPAGASHAERARVPPPGRLPWGSYHAS